MITFLKIAGLFCIASIFVSLLHKDIVRLIYRIFNIPLVPLKTIDKKLGTGINKIYNKVTDSGLPFLVYFFMFMMLVFGCIASYGDFLLADFSLEVVGLGNAVIARTKSGVITGAVVLAVFLVVSQWIFGYLDKKKKEQAKQENRRNGVNKKSKKLSWFMLAFIGIVLVEAGLSYFRTVEIDPTASVPIVDVFMLDQSDENNIELSSDTGISTEAKAVMALVITVLTSIAIGVVSGVALEVGFYGIMLFVLIVVIAILNVIRGITWLIWKIINGVSLILYGILSLLNSWGNSLIQSFKYFRKSNKDSNKLTTILILSLLFSSLLNSGCFLPPENSGKTEIVIILDTSGSFRYSLKKAVEKSKQVITHLPPNSELTAIKIDDHSYRQCREIFHLKTPSRSTQQTYARQAKAIYDRRINKLQKAAIDSLEKLLRIRSSPATDICGAIVYSTALFSDNTSKKILIVMSDFLHNTNSVIDSSCSFKDISIWALFVEHATDSPIEYRKRIAEYENYFIERGSPSVRFLNPIATSRLSMHELLELDESGGVL